MRLACGEAALHRAGRDAFAYRCGGSTGWLDCGAVTLPVSRLTARAGGARASTKTRASVGGGAGSVKAKRATAGCSARPRHRAGSRIRRPRDGFARIGRCAIVCAAFGARTRICAHAVKRETGGECPPGLCCPRNGTPPARRACRARPGRPRCHCPSAGGKAAAWQAASPDTGRRKGRARCSPNARSAGDGWGAYSARARAGFARSIMSCLSVGSRCAARFPLSTASTRCAPCRPR